MKRIFILFVAFFIATSAGFSQPWAEYLPAKKEKSYTLFDYQKAFNKYCEEYEKTHGDIDQINMEDEDLEYGIPGYAQFKRWEWYWEPRVNPKTGEFPDKTAWEVWQEYKQQKGIKSVGGTWTSRGDAVLDPYDAGSIQESGTGRINCAHFDPNDDNRFWVGAPAGGLWQTTDGGATWTCLTDNNPVLGVSDIAIPPDYDPSTNPTIYIATGDRDAGDDPSIGILKTTDGGTTWTQTGLTFEAKSGVKIGRIIINPDDKNIMWAATSVGIYKSTDAGATWTFKQGGDFIDMELFPGTTSAGNGVLLASNNRFEPKVYRSNDGGETWAVVYDASSYTGTQFRADVAVTEADNSVAYFIMADYDNSMAFEALFKSTDQGQTWTEVYNQSTNNLYAWNENNAASAGGQGWYDVALAVASNNANVVYVGGVNAFISTNGGASFTICNEWDPAAGGNADYVHADHHNAYFRPSDNRLFDCNDGGFYYCDNYTLGGNSDWTAITDGLVTGQLYDIGVAQTLNNEYITGFQDNGTKLVKTASTDFDQVIGGDGMCCAINPNNNNIQYGTYAQMRVYKSTNDGGSFSIIRNAGSADWAGPVEADPQGGEVIIGDEYVKQYSGSGTTWNTLSQSLDGTNYLKVLDVYNDGTNMVIWAASPAGCWKSPVNSNASGTYTQIAGLPADQVTDIAIDEDDYNHVYLCFGGFDNTNVWETTDGGNTWTDISEGLPAVPCGAIVINEQNTTKNEVYVGTDAGIYVKLGDAPWQLFNDGMPLVSITDLEIYYDNTTPSNTRIYASTYGRGAWSSDCYEPPTLDATISNILVPADEYCSLGNITPTVTLSNIGTTTITSATVSYTLDGGAAVTQNWSGSLAQGQSTNITFPSIALSYGTHDFVATVSSPNGSTDQNTSNDSKSKTYSVWDNSLAYTQDFDDFTLNIGYNGTQVILEECWTNDDSESTLDWSVTQGQTPSGGTGPDGDHTSGNGKYLYTEVSGITSATPVNLLSPVFDLSNFSSADISFWYCLNGANCGSLQIDLFYAGTWHNGITANWNGTSATSVSGNLGNTWYQVTADVSAAVGNNDFQVRISSTTGTDYDGDIAIDDFNINGVVACTAPTPQASNIAFSNITNNSATISWTPGGGDADLVVVKAGSAVDQDPTSGNTYTANSVFGSGSELGTGNFVVYDGTAGTVDITNLNENTTYYVAVYTYNAADHCYNVTELTGNFTTYGPPTVTTAAVTSITDVSATSGGNVTADNGATVTARGVCWNTTGSPTISDSKTTDGSGTGTFTSNITGLSAVTTYYVRAYATNAYGTSYGNEETFTTACGTINLFPYTQNFDSWATSSPAVACTSDGTVNLDDCWTNVTGEPVSTAIDWDVFTGSTASSSTGPSGDHTSGSGNYLYTESSGTCTGIGYITSPTFDLTVLSDATLTFWYHMYGASMQTMSVQVSTDGGSTWSSNIWSLSGDQGDAWLQATVDLSPYITSNSVVIRWIGDLSGNTSYTSDMAIDDVNLNGTPAPTAISWNGSVSNDWQTTANWDGGAIPTSSDNIIIPNGCPNYPLVDDGTTVAECNDMTIESSASVTIAPNGRMTVNGAITNNAGNAGLTIQSDATGTGSLIQNSTSNIDATVQLYFPATTRAWHMLASPITAAPVTVFPSTSNLYYYDESTDDFWTGSNYDAGSTMGWTAFTSGNMTVGKGYLFNYYQNTMTFTGQLNTSTAGTGLPINYTDHGTTAPNGASYNDYDGWNLVANPFTSAIDWTAVNAGAANLYDAIYVWDGINGTYKSWVNGTDSWDGASTNGGSQYIPPMQGFFVKVNEALGTSGTLDIPAAARVHNSQAFWKNDSYETPEDFLRLRVVANNHSDETVVRFKEGATTDVDDHLDAYKLFTYLPNVPQIYTRTMNKHTEYSINTLPELRNKVIIPLIIYTNSEKFSIFVDEMKFDNAIVTLRPVFENNQEQKLSLGQEYKYASKSNDYQLFELIFTPTSTTDINAQHQANVEVFPNPSTGKFDFVVDNNNQEYTVSITDFTGKVIYETTTDKSILNIDLSDYAQGVYIARITMQNNFVINKKIIIH